MRTAQKLAGFIAHEGVSAPRIAHRDDSLPVHSRRPVRHRYGSWADGARRAPSSATTRPESAGLTHNSRELVAKLRSAPARRGQRRQLLTAAAVLARSALLVARLGRSTQWHGAGDHGPLAGLR